MAFLLVWDKDNYTKFTILAEIQIEQYNLKRQNIRPIVIYDTLVGIDRYLT
jgi:hypothetical protein